MTRDDLQTLYDYNYWANARLLASAARLTRDDFVRPVAGTYGSVRTTLVHIMSAEGGIIERSGGPQRGAPLQAEAFPEVQDVVTYWRGQERTVRGYLASLTDADLTRRVAFRSPLFADAVDLSLGEILQHAATHAIHHRGQVSLLLRALGQPPGDVDLLLYYAALSQPGH